MKNSDVARSESYGIGDLVKYWDEWNEIYHLGIIVGKDSNLIKTSFPTSGGYLVYFAGSIPGYLQPISNISDRMIFSCHGAMLEKIS